MTTDTVRLNVCKADNQKESKLVIVNRNDWIAFLKQASNKLRIKVKRVFTQEGEELSDNDLKNAQKVTNNMVLIVTSGAEFHGNKKITTLDLKYQIIGLSDENKELFGPQQKDHNQCVVRIISHESLIEDEAIKQLHFTATLPNMRLAVGLPDLHPGKGFPIGSANASEGVIYPHLVGTDIGCGMSLYKTSLKTKKIKLDQWVQLLHGLESSWTGDTSTWLKSRGVKETDYDKTHLGTIGGGNHFAELQQVEKVVDEETFKKMGLDCEHLYLLVHSGSRAFGEAIYQFFVDTYGTKGLAEGSKEAREYLVQHDHALAWARCNRSLIAHRFLSCLKGLPIDVNCNSDLTKDQTADGSVRVLDVWHNYVVKINFQLNNGPSNNGKQTDTTPNNTNTNNNCITSEKRDENPQMAGFSLWLHRKGAAPSTEGPVVIPGSRGHMSYLVLPTPKLEEQEKSAYSLAHGAGRKWNRGKALQMGKNIRKRVDYTTTELGSKVICENKDLLYEEMPAAYKDIEAIISDLQRFGLITVVAIFRPLITYKTRVIKYFLLKIFKKTYCTVTPTSQVTSSSKKPSDSLARDLLALERTYLAWVRTSILCFSLGVAMSEYRRFLPEGDPKKQNQDTLTYKIEKFGGFGIIVAGQLVLMKSTIRYFTTSRKLMRGDLFTTNKLGVILLSSLVAIASGIACLGTLPFTREQTDKLKTMDTTKVSS